MYSKNILKYFIAFPNNNILCVYSSDEKRRMFMEELLVCLNDLFSIPWKKNVTNSTIRIGDNRGTLKVISQFSFHKTKGCEFSKVFTDEAHLIKREVLHEVKLFIR